MKPESLLTGENAWNSIDVRLLRVLQALLTECSVSKAARRLNQSQPATSKALQRLREITGDQLLVRTENRMVPTERGAALLEPVNIALAQIESIVVSQVRFDPLTSRRVFNMAMPDYLSATLLGHVVARMRASAPLAQLVIHSLGPDYDFAAALESGVLDVVIGNWPEPPQQLRLTPLFQDRVVGIVRRDHPLAGGPVSAEDYMRAEHLAPTPYSVGRRSVIEAYFAQERLQRNIVTFVPYFNIVPYVLLATDLLFTSMATFANQLAERFPLSIVDVEIEFPLVDVYLLWHDRAHYAQEGRWFRNQILSATQDALGKAFRASPFEP